MRLHRNTLTSIALGIVIIMMGACNSDAWDELPSAISKFVSQYFPFGELQSYTSAGGVETVKIKGGATLTFDSDYEWTDVNGNGAVLPSQFLYDKLPSRLYDYLESIEAQNSVYRVSRTETVITVDLLDSILTYDLNTGDITYPSAKNATATYKAGNLE